MVEKILFTCVGTTDPVRNLRDGGMLHIIRHYRPRKVYIVLSQRMEEFSRQDDRYRRAIEKFSRDTGCPVETHLIASGIRDVSDFDAFDTLFQQLMRQIVRENPNCEILFNISSGSPQMKIAMCLLAADAKFPHTTAVQVKTPEKGPNVSLNTASRSYDPETEIELNEDNAPESENRCSEPRLFGIKKELVHRQVQTLLENYEYTAASILMDTSGMAETAPDARLLTEHLRLRQTLKTQKAEKLTAGRNFGLELFPVRHAGCREDTEFFLVLQNLSRTGKITEFVLRLNPFVIRMQELYLLKKCGIDCKALQTLEKRGGRLVAVIRRADIERLDPALMRYLDDSFGAHGYHNDSPSITLYNRMLAFTGGRDAESVHYRQFFTVCEQINQERNSSAHSLYGIDENDLARNYMGSREILSTLRKLLAVCYGSACRDEIFDIYDRVNHRILAYL